MGTLIDCVFRMEMAIMSTTATTSEIRIASALRTERASISRSFSSRASEEILANSRRFCPVSPTIRSCSIRYRAASSAGIRPLPTRAAISSNSAPYRTRDARMASRRARSFSVSASVASSLSFPASAASMSLNCLRYVSSPATKNFLSAALAL